MLQEKLELLLEKYDVSTKAEINSNDGEYTVTIDGKVYPLLAHRFERRFTELHKMYHDGTLEGPSHIRCSHIGSFGDSPPPRDPPGKCPRRGADLVSGWQTT